MLILGLLGRFSQILVRKYTEQDEMISSVKKENEHWFVLFISKCLFFHDRTLQHGE